MRDGAVNVQLRLNDKANGFLDYTARLIRIRYLLFPVRNLLIICDSRDDSVIQPNGEGLHSNKLSNLETTVLASMISMVTVYFQVKTVYIQLRHA